MLEDNKKENNEVTLDGVILDKDTKEAILNTINFIRNKEKYEEMGCKVPKGILLEGLPGTGKSLLAEVISNESNYKFKFVCGSELLGQYVGSSAKIIRETFDELKKENSLLYIDEIDAIGSVRDTNESSKEYRSALNQLLTCMSSPEYNKIMVMASTNVLDQLDPALIRPGRFDRILKINLPTWEMRVDIFKLYVGKLKHSDDIDYELLADKTEGKSGAFIGALCNFSGMRAVNEDSNVTKMEHILKELEVMEGKDDKVTKRIGF